MTVSAGKAPEQGCVLAGVRARLRVVLEELPSPWPEVFSLMWEAYAAGTIPVGAVVVDESREVVSRGRNRIFSGGVNGQLAGSRLAHAEMNALLSFVSDRTYGGFELYTALEPCHLCLSAAFAVRIGTVRCASPDRYGGAVGKLLPSRDHSVHPVRVDGPLSGSAGRLPELLLVAHFLWRVPDGDVATFYRTKHRRVLAAAERLPRPDSGATLKDALLAVTAA
jgi:tRNA(adenine34) deaminase